jgi:hypothetical protein
VFLQRHFLVVDQCFRTDKPSQNVGEQPKNIVAYIPRKAITTDVVTAIMTSFQEVSVLEKDVPSRRFSRTRLFSPGRILHITYVKKSGTDKWVFLHM